VAELTMRDAVARGLAQEMRRDDRVFLLGEDVEPGGVFKATVGLVEEFGRSRVRNTPISEQAILGAAMGAAMTGMRPVAEIMFSDFLAVAWDYIANEMSKFRYMSDGQASLPLVVRAANGGGVRLGPQHSQAVENWVMAIPGLKVVAPSTPVDTLGLLASAIRDPDPVIFLESKALYAAKGEVPDGEVVVPLGKAEVVRSGRDATIVAVGSMVPRSLEAAIRLAAAGLDVTVVDLRTLVPLDVTTVLAEVARTGCLFTVEENPRLCGWGAEIASLAAEEIFDHLDGPIVRITTPHIPVPFAESLEDAALPSVDRIVATVASRLGA
jgi:pyruvate dehydrogenase E1 component beta subunit